ncbi:hypothetical protein Asp14428_34100 [Actinoplanes sp. NBRC 14428]|nr:hypothetical protein Asp14428_34100 [Actinoplanes sp. NBRC 14428]
MLVSFSRTGPLRHRILKGFVVVADDPAAVIAAALRRPDLGPLRPYTSDRAPGAVWLDTGMVWLTDPVARARLRRALAGAPPRSPPPYAPPAAGSSRAAGSAPAVRATGSVPICTPSRRSPTPNGRSAPTCCGRGCPNSSR